MPFALSVQAQTNSHACCHFGPRRDRRMSVFPLKFRDGPPGPLCTFGDSNGRLGLLEISIEGGEEAGQRSVTVSAPELLLGD